MRKHPRQLRGQVEIDFEKYNIIGRTPANQRHLPTTDA